MDTPTEPSTKYRLAKNVTVFRPKSREGAFELMIDGEPFPYMLDGNNGVSTTIAPDKAPQVTLTILAETVSVVDTLLDGAFSGQEHTHDVPGHGDGA